MRHISDEERWADFKKHILLYEAAFALFVLVGMIVGWLAALLCGLIGTPPVLSIIVFWAITLAVPWIGQGRLQNLRLRGGQ